jgi:hypothetical protein
MVNYCRQLVCPWLRAAATAPPGGTSAPVSGVNLNGDLAVPAPGPTTHPALHVKTLQQLSSTSAKASGGRTEGQASSSNEPALATAPEPHQAPSLPTDYTLLRALVHGHIMETTGTIASPTATVEIMNDGTAAPASVPEEQPSAALAPVDPAVAAGVIALAGHKAPLGISTEQHPAPALAPGIRYKTLNQINYALWPWLWFM